MEQLESGFKRKIDWNKYQSGETSMAPSLEFRLLDWFNVSRGTLNFLLLFENNIFRKEHVNIFF